MTTPLIAPSSRVWDRIEKILDEQDQHRMIADKMIEDSFLHHISYRRRMYLAVVTGASLLGGIIWSVFKFS